jgi:hypothetical protein
VPPQLPGDAFDDLPEAPGVYVFYAENVVLYVGKSANLRTGVLSHFSGDRRGPRDVQIMHEVVHIDWTETPGDLGALIEASRLVKVLKPIHNRHACCPEKMVLQPWPFRGRVGIRETAAQFERSELIVLDRWCYLGTVRAEHELQEIEEREPVFDADTYRILARFLRKPRRASPVIDLAAH